MLQLFPAGTRRDANGIVRKITESDLEKAAANYDPRIHEAPLLPFHNESAPTAGLIKTLVYSAGSLWGVPHKVDPAFAEQVTSGRLPKISVRFYGPDSPENPTPGNYYLRHVGFVPIPAAKGMAEPVFAEPTARDYWFQDMEYNEASTLLTIFRNFREYFIEKESLAAADRLIPAYLLEYLSEQMMREQIELVQEMNYQEQPMDTNTSASTPDPEFAEREAKIAAREAEISARLSKIAEQEKQIRKDQHFAFAESVIAKITPAKVDSVVSIMESIASGTIEFAEGGKNPLEEFKNLLKALPDAINTKPSTPDRDTIEFAEWTPEEEATKIAEYAKKHGVTVMAAQAQIRKGAE